MTTLTKSKKKNINSTRFRVKAISSFNFKLISKNSNISEAEVTNIFLFLADRINFQSWLKKASNIYHDRIMLKIFPLYA